MKGLSMSSVLSAMTGLLLAGLVLCHFTGLSFWWALGLSALGLLVPAFAVLDFGGEDDSPAGTDS
jgi:hypothetical protein